MNDIKMVTDGLMDWHTLIVANMAEECDTLTLTKALLV